MTLQLSIYIWSDIVWLLSFDVFPSLITICHVRSRFKHEQANKTDQPTIKFEKMPCQDKAPTRGASHVDLLAPPPNADHWISPSSLNRASSVLIAQFHSPIIKLDSPPTQVVTPFHTKLQFWTKTYLLRYSSEIARVIRTQTDIDRDWLKWIFGHWFPIISLLPISNPSNPKRDCTKIAA